MQHRKSREERLAELKNMREARASLLHVIQHAPNTLAKEDLEKYEKVVKPLITASVVSIIGGLTSIFIMRRLTRGCSLGLKIAGIAGVPLGIMFTPPIMYRSLLDKVVADYKAKYMK